MWRGIGVHALRRTLYSYVWDAMCVVMCPPCTDELRTFACTEPYRILFMLDNGACIGPLHGRVARTNCILRGSCGRQTRHGGAADDACGGPRRRQGHRRRGAQLRRRRHRPHLHHAPPGADLRCASSTHPLRLRRCRGLSVKMTVPERRSHLRVSCPGRCAGHRVDVAPAPSPQAVMYALATFPCMLAYKFMHSLPS